MQILIGCDPECFVKRNGQFVSAYGLIKGDKKNPFAVPYGAVQVDGMALEFNIDPAKNEDEFLFNVQEVFATLKQMVPEYQVVATPVADFDINYLMAQPVEALELGCDPDYNAWSTAANERPDGDRPMRTASGHVHIGWTQNADKDSPVHQGMGQAAVKQMDFFLGLPSLLYDNDTRRRSMYGKAGACRFKSYGVEYRTLSNAWLNSEKLIKWVFNNTKIGMERLMSGEMLYEKYGDIQDIINSSDVRAANTIINDANIPVPV